MKKRFINIVDFYSENVSKLNEKQNYHLWPIKVAQELGYESEIWILDPYHISDASANIPGWANPRIFQSKLKYLLALFKEKDSFIYTGTRVWRTAISCFFGRRTLFFNYSVHIPQKWWQRILLKFTLNTFDHIRTNTEQENIMLKEFGIPEHKLIRIPNVVDLEFWRQRKELDRNKYGIKPDEKYIIMIGNLRKLKNVDCLLKAIKQLEIRAVIIGEDMDEEEKIEDKIKRYGVNDKVIITGRLSQKEIHPLLYHASVFVHPSLNDGASQTAWEAASVGIPLCLSDITAFHELHGLFHQNENELAENIKKFLNNQSLNDKFMKKNKEVTDQSSYENVTRLFKDAIK